MHIKVLSYNIHKGRSALGLRYLLDDIKQAVHATQADIVFLQEIHGFHSDDSKELEDPLEYIADTAWHHYRYGRNSVYPNGHHGNAILSKFPIVNFSNTDISKTPFASRGLLHAVIQIPGHLDELHLMNAHLDLFEFARQRQYKQITEYIQQYIPENSPIILAGDFNDWMNLGTKAFAKANMEEAFYKSKNKLAKTFPSFLPILSLDRIYYRGLQLTTAETPQSNTWSQLSDHIPLLVSFHL